MTNNFAFYWGTSLWNSLPDMTIECMLRLTIASVLLYRKSVFISLTCYHYGPIKVWTSILARALLLIVGIVAESWPEQLLQKKWNSKKSISFLTYLRFFNVLLSVLPEFLFVTNNVCIGYKEERLSYLLFRTGNTELSSY